jgi:hypothetical protein
VTRTAPLLDFEAIATRFDASIGSPRFVLLLSPTCPVCLDGARLVGESLKILGSPELSTHVVWLPVLDADTYTAAGTSSGLFDPDRVTHYWDEERELERSFRAMLGLERWGRKVAWDLYLLYDRASRWSDRPPEPTHWMHQLQIDDVPSLDRPLLLDRLRELSGE